MSDSNILDLNDSLFAIFSSGEVATKIKNLVEKNYAYFNAFKFSDYLNHRETVVDRIGSIVGVGSKILDDMCDYLDNSVVCDQFNANDFIDRITSVLSSDSFSSLNGSHVSIGEYLTFYIFDEIAFSSHVNSTLLDTLNVGLDDVRYFNRKILSSEDIFLPIITSDTQYKMLIYSLKSNEFVKLSEIVEFECFRNFIFGFLSERSRFILENRYGFNGYEKKTLQVLADELGGLTRERIRQVEEDSFSTLRSVELVSCCVRCFLDDFSSDVYFVLSGGKDFVSRKSVQSRKKLVPSYFMFILDFLNMGFVDWLNSFALFTDEGWIVHSNFIRSFQVADLFSIKYANYLFPCPLSYFNGDIAEADQKYLENLGFGVYGGYVYKGKLSLKTMRIINLHKSVEFVSDHGLFDFHSLFQYYRVHHVDEIQSRVMLSDMKKHVNLFFHVFDGLWFDMSSSYVGVCRKIPYGYGIHLNDTFDPDTISGHIVQLFDERAPLLGTEIKDRLVEEMHDDDVSEASFQVILLLNPSFRRISMGVYSDREGSLVDDNLYLIMSNERHFMSYLNFRHEGADQNYFYGWNSDLERKLTLWSEVNCANDVFHSMLSVCDPKTWLNSNESEVNHYLSLKKSSGNWFESNVVENIPDFKFVDFQSFLTVLIHIRVFGWIGAYSVNRCAGLNLFSVTQRPRNVLTLLKSLKLIEGEDFGGRFRASRIFDEFFDELMINLRNSLFDSKDFDQFLKKHIRRHRSSFEKIDSSFTDAWIDKVTGTYMVLSGL